jgi:hypothetical protein
VYLGLSGQESRHEARGDPVDRDADETERLARISLLASGCVTADAEREARWRFEAHLDSAVVSVPPPDRETALASLRARGDFVDFIELDASACGSLR